MASVSWTDPALDSLRETCAIIEHDSPRVAEIFANRAFVATDRLGMFPFSGRVVPEFETSEVREVIFGNYRIIYEIFGQNVDIIAFVHGARQLGPELLGRK